MQTDLNALVERVEAATGADRLLDAEIMVAIKSATFLTARLYMLGKHPAAGAGPDDDWRNATILFQAVPYTASLDAARTLVPEGYFWTAGRCDLTCHASVGPDNAHFDHNYLVAHQPIDVDIPNPSTPALALCAAALRARMEAGG